MTSTSIGGEKQAGIIALGFWSNMINDKNRSVQKSIEGLSEENAYLKQQEKPEKYPKTNIQNYA